MQRSWVVVLALGGCDQLFNLSEIPLHDAPTFIPARDCPQTYSELLVGGTRYRLIDINRSPQSHHVDCLDDTDGFTHLAVIDQSSESTDLPPLLDGMASTSSWFVGAAQQPNAESVIAGWRWLTGQPLESWAWGSFEPDDTGAPEDGEEDFADLVDFTAGLRDVDADAPRGALCECDGQAVDPAVAALFGL